MPEKIELKQVKLKQCWHCGVDAIPDWLHPESIAVCEMCGEEHEIDFWQQRPLEDALRAKLDSAFSELTALVNVIEFDDILTDPQIIEILKSVITELEAGYA